MGVFDDKKFDSLDWISQATEPIDSPLNEILAKLPNEFIIDFETFVAIKSNGYYHYSHDVDVDYVVNYLINQNKDIDYRISSGDKSVLCECFKFEMTKPVVMDFENKIINGEIKLVKIVDTLEEDTLKDMLGVEGIQSVSSTFFTSERFSRANEVMELLGKCEKGIRTRSPRNKKTDLVNRLKEIFNTNEWNIRDTELANKVGYWIRGYIENGNLADWSNFCRLKVMTHKGQPIYSMEEVK